MTKEMTAGRRVDILTDALLHHAKHRLQQFGLYVNIVILHIVNTKIGRICHPLIYFFP